MVSMKNAKKAYKDKSSEDVIEAHEYHSEAAHQIFGQLSESHDQMLPTLSRFGPLWHKS